MNIWEIVAELGRGRAAHGRIRSPHEAIEDLGMDDAREDGARSGAGRGNDG